MKIILLMLLGHFLADYTLQGWLAYAKQISWWRKETDNPLFSHDCITGLLCHSLYWSLITFLPLYELSNWPIIVISNAAIHAFIDHDKANAQLISLWQDQLMHLCQIVMTYMIFCQGL